MKKIIVKTISAALVFVLTLAALSSCGWYPFGDPRSIFPEGYTGGWGIEYGSGEEIYWVETYEEAVAAMDQLKSHGSTFYKTAIFSYEGELFDTKYCFMFQGKKDNVKFGDNPYDRWAENVIVQSVGFFEDVTIDELVYSDIDDYLWFKCATPHNFNELCEKYHNISSLPLEYMFSEETYQHSLYYGEELVVFLIGSVYGDGKPKVAKECGETVMNSIIFLGFDN